MHPKDLPLGTMDQREIASQSRARCTRVDNPPSNYARSNTEIRTYWAGEQHIRKIFANRSPLRSANTDRVSRFARHATNEQARRHRSVSFKEQPPATRDRERRRRPIHLLRNQSCMPLSSQGTAELR